MSETCPNGCDLAIFGTHQGPPDCDLSPADPGAMLTSAVVVIDGQPRTVEVALSSSQQATIGTSR